MIFYEDDIITEVRRNREELLEEYGGIEGLHKHMKEELPFLIQQGWKMVSAEEVAAKKKCKTAVG
ncbi:MAG: hypothetical protein Ta2G_12870 [Termitinemataceae bacterium]|nr:hypothetical protein FACS1894102_5510 [Spirochaetia bacterium]GMO54060.1 MAG: hypothetical protein Ta2G_12870 [Termitinemataceae bacterium]